MTRLQILILANAALFSVAACLAPAQAAERVYLRNGSDVICDHQKNINGEIRLYLAPSEASYLDVAPGDILRQEFAPAALEKESAHPPKAAVHEKAPEPQAAPAPVDLPALLNQVGAKHHLDPDLLASVVRAESGDRAHVVSRAGARGLMQLMPGTAADLGVRDSFAPEENVAGGTTYLDALLMYYHDNVALALAAYNAGPAAVDRFRGIPPYAETRRYVARVIHDYNQRKLREARQHSRHISRSSTMAAIVTRP